MGLHCASVSCAFQGPSRSAGAINSSLHTLTRVVAAYAAAPPGQRPAHVPFRESLLTLMLRDSIGGNCRTAVIVTLSGDEDQLPHSLKSCHFARLARGVSNCARANRSYDPAIALDALRAQVAELEQELRACEAARDEALAAAASATSSLGALEDLMACATATALDTRLRAWAEATLPWGDPDDLRGAVGRLGAVIAALQKCVKATGAVTQSEATSADASTCMTTPRAPLPREALDASTQVSPLPIDLPVDTVATPEHSEHPRTEEAAKSHKSSAARSARSQTSDRSPPTVRYLSTAERHTALQASALSLADACEDYAREIEAQALPQARLMRDLSERLNQPQTTGGVRMLEEQVELTRRRADELRTAATAAAWGRGGAGEPQTLDDAPPPPPRLGPSAICTWEVGGASVAAPGAWSQLPAPVAALLDEALLGGTTGYTRSLVLVSPSAAPRLVSVPCGFRLPAIPSESPRIVCHPALEAAWQQSVGLDSIAPYTFSLLDAHAGVQRCCVHGATRVIRRRTAVVLRGFLRKRGQRSGAWRSRAFALTPAGLHQINPLFCSATPSSESSTADAQARLLESWISRTKLTFDGGKTTAAIAPAVSEAGLDSAVCFVVSQRASGDNRSVTLEFAAGSLDEAAMWVAAINTVACGSYSTSCNAAPPSRPQATALADVRAPATANARGADDSAHCGPLIEAQLELQLRRARSGWGASVSESAPGPGVVTLGGRGPAAAHGPPPPEDWCGRGPAAVPALLLMPPAQWHFSGEGVVSELLVSEETGRLAQMLGFANFAVIVLVSFRG